MRSSMTEVLFIAMCCIRTWGFTVGLQDRVSPWMQRNLGSVARRQRKHVLGKGRRHGQNHRSSGLGRDETDLALLQSDPDWAPRFRRLLAVMNLEPEKTDADFSSEFERGGD